MRIAVLTSSRADYSIYYPLLKKISNDSFFQLEVIAFGTHVSQLYGYTLKHILEDGFTVTAIVESLVLGDSPEAINSAMGLTITRFTSIWNKSSYDLVFCLGDRYEMFAAVASCIAFNIPLAHIHGGETTLGAIDNIFRHSISLMSTYHFTTTEQYKRRVVELIGSDQHVYNVGALSIDNLKSLPLYSLEEFNNKFQIDLSIPTILITFHPETVSFEKNEQYINELVSALSDIADYQLIITMPNADTTGTMIRQKLNNFICSKENAIGIESFGTVGYLSCMKHCTMLLGNTSSGFVEASYFPKYVINLGTRQQGRILTPNIINCTIERKAILDSIRYVENLPSLSSIDIYGSGNASNQIIQILKSLS
jgi:GDP/UDP-N,N'-diacetylbacillosamine 2-epimerase (hydrolysing)